MSYCRAIESQDTSKPCYRVVIRAETRGSTQENPRNATSSVQTLKLTYVFGPKSG
jgi:hypothetical protein